MADVLNAAVADPLCPARSRDRVRRLILLRELGWALGTAVLTGAAALVSIELTRATSQIAILWAANAVALVAWLVARRSPRVDGLQLAATVAGFLGANLIVNGVSVGAAVFTVLDALEVAVALCLVRRVSPAGLALETLRGLVRFVVSVALVAPAPSALGVGLYFAALGRPAVDGGLTFYFGHAIGFAVFGVFLLQLSSRYVRELFSADRAAETLAALGLMAMVSVFAFSDSSNGMGFLVYPALMLAAVRLRLFGASAATLIVSVMSAAFLLRDVASGVLVGEAAAEMVRHSQLYVGFACLPTLAVAVILDERDGYARDAAARQAQAEIASQGKSKLLANVSHEVRTPLNAVIGFSDILLTRRLGPLNDQQEDLLKTIVRSADQLNALAQDLIDVAKAEAGKLSVAPVRMDLRVAAEDVLQRLRVKAAEHGAEIVLEGEGSLHAVADPMRVAQILTNLGTNAIKYAGHGGPVTLRLYRPAAGRVRLEVEDHGPGIPLDRRSELFEPFNRLGKESGQIDGTGIGLAIARRLAELQDGRLDYYSEPGRGARFWLDLPEAAEEPAQAELRAA